MSVVDDRTPIRNWPKPHETNNLSDDVLRLKAALDAVDSDVAAIILALAGKAATLHSHELTDIIGLATALASKAALNHDHAFDDLTDVTVAGATNGQFLKRIANFWQPAGLAISDVANLQSAIDAQRPISNITDLQAALDGKAALKGSSVIIPRGNTAGRPTGTVAEALIRYNTSTQSFEGWNGAMWGKIGGGAPTGSTPPSPAQDGDLWWSRDLGILFIYFDDGDSQQWVSTNVGADPASILLRLNNLADLSNADAALANLGGNASGRDIFKNATPFGATWAKLADIVAARSALAMGEELIGYQKLPSAAGSINFTANVGDYVKIRASGRLFPVTGGGYTGFRLSKDAGATWLAGASDYFEQLGYFAGGGYAATGYSAAFGYLACAAVPAASPVKVSLELDGSNENGITLYDGRSTFNNGAGSIIDGFHGGQTNTVGANGVHNGIQFMSSVGQLAAGSYVYLYGQKG